MKCNRVVEGGVRCGATIPYVQVRRFGMCSACDKVRKIKMAKKIRVEAEDIQAAWDKVREERIIRDRERKKRKIRARIEKEEEKEEGEKKRVNVAIRHRLSKLGVRY